MKIIFGFVPIMMFCLLSGCLNDGSLAYEKNLNGPYYVDAADDYKEMAIGVQDGKNGVGVIKPTVFAIGQNSNFIIVKQHPLDETGNIDKATINYFIIPLKQTVSRAIDSNYFGPLSFGEFNAKRNELGINNVEFAIVFKELE